MQRTRRSFLTSGLGGIAGAGLLPLPYAAQCLADPDSVPRTDRSIILILLAGGLSHIDSFDPKPEAPANVRGEFGTIQTAVPGVHFTDQLPKLSVALDQFVLLRGVSHDVAIHEPGQKLVLSGVNDFRDQTPSLGAVASHQLPRLATVPSYAFVPSTGPNAGELGQFHEPFNVLGDSGRLLNLGPHPEDQSQIENFQRRLAILRALESGVADTKTAQGLTIRQQAYGQATDSLLSKPMRLLADLGSEPDAIRDLYGRSVDGDYLLLARRFIEAGTRFVTVRLDGWDTHYDSFPELKSLLPAFDHALAGLLADLRDRGRLSSTMIGVVTEFGRTPTISGGGRSHWPKAGMALLAGGRFRSGLVYGRTNQSGADVLEDRCSPQDLAFTLLQELGISPNRTYLPPTGRVLLPEGQMIAGVIQDQP